MLYCERCESPNVTPLVLMANKLREYEIDPSDFYGSPPDKQRELITNGIDINAVDITKSCPRGLSLVVVKPEVFPFAREVERYMSESRGFQLVDSQPFTYTREAYYSIYKRLFTDLFSEFPYGPMLMLMATSLRSQAILFEHNLPEEGDTQIMLNQLERGGVELSVRYNVTIPLVKELGFSTMDQSLCSGRCFDLGGSFSKRAEPENLRTFNGLHIPNDKAELNRTFIQLSTIIDAWQTI